MTGQTASEASPQPEQITSNIQEVLERAHTHVMGNNRRMTTIRDRLYGAQLQTSSGCDNPDKPDIGILDDLLTRVLDVCNLLDAQAQIITDLERT